MTDPSCLPLVPSSHSTPTYTSEAALADATGPTYRTVPRKESASRTRVTSGTSGAAVGRTEGEGSAMGGWGVGGGGRFRSRLLDDGGVSN